MPVSDSKKKANEKYTRNHYDELKMRVPKGKKAEIQEHAENRGESLNGFLNRAVNNQMQKDKEGNP